MKLIMFINVKMLTIVSILTFMSMIHTSKQFESNNILFLRSIEISLSDELSIQKILYHLCLYMLYIIIIYTTPYTDFYPFEMLDSIY